MKDRVALVVAVAAAAAYVLSVVVLWDHARDGDAEWGRRMLLFGGIEAIAFAAVGWLFGKEVHRSAAEAAQKSNERANDESVARAKAEDRGRTLAEAVRATSNGQELAPAAPGTLSLHDLAEQLFPRDG